MSEAIKNELIGKRLGLRGLLPPLARAYAIIKGYSAIKVLAHTRVEAKGKKESFSNLREAQMFTWMDAESLRHK